jgi:hypothetical protein
MVKQIVLSVTMFSATMWMAAKCDGTVECTLMAPMDDVEISVVPEAVGSAAPGSYLLRFGVDSHRVDIEWTVDANGEVSEAVIAQDNPKSPYFNLNIEKTELIDTRIGFLCPESPVKEVTGVLFFEDTQVDEFAFEPTYDNVQPSEPNGAGCGKCWHMNEDTQVITGPINPAHQI